MGKLVRALCLATCIGISQVLDADGIVWTPKVMLTTMSESSEWPPMINLN